MNVTKNSSLATTCVLQTDLDTISAWSKDNNMNLNPKILMQRDGDLPLHHTPDSAPLLLNKVPFRKSSISQSTWHDHNGQIKVK